MPHQCTTCGRTFADGSKEMLSGCPDCGGNKFQFKPAAPRTPTSDSTADDAPDSTAESDATTASRADQPPVGADDEQTDTPSSSSPSSSSTSSASSAPSASSSNAPQPRSPSESRTEPSPTADSSASSSPSSTGAGTPPSPNRDDDHDAEVEHRSGDPRPPAEDHAQASARSDIVSPDELADAASDARRTPDDVDGRVIEPESEDRPGLDELREELNSQFESIKIVSPGQYELNLMELYDRQEYIISLQEDGRYVIEVPGSWGDRDED
jgi:hypothetical protein